MIESNHIQDQISDYVLGLLSSSEQRRVEKHAVACDQCRLAIQRESRLGQAVRATVVRIPTPDRQRLHQLMPPLPSRRQLRWRLLWQRQLAPACLVLLILLSSWGLRRATRYSAWTNPGEDMMAATATTTDTPTATLAQTKAARSGSTFIHWATAVPIQPDALATPAPKPTPIAAATQLAAYHSLLSIP